MGRPKPTILTEVTNKDTYKTDQVLASDGIWAVYYQGRPINIKTQNMLISYPGPKYKKVAFSSAPPAINLAKKLNKQFKTTDFSVVKLTAHETIFPN